MSGRPDPVWLSRVALAPLVLLVGTGCVEATTGPTSAPPRAPGPPFHVLVTTPGSAPPPHGAGGAVDRVTPGAVTVAEGWAPERDAELILVMPAGSSLVNARRELRPDAAAAVGSPDAGLGFRVTVRINGDPSALCVLARRGDDVRRLAGGDGRTCPA